MHIWVGVENFAKIESAKICINNYTVLVGQNNSGKTFLMQLVQGISNKLAYYVDEVTMNKLSVGTNSVFKEYSINSENILILVECINEKLALQKENIVKEIFGKDIPIEKLYIDISLEDDISYKFSIFDSNLGKEETDKEFYNGEMTKLASQFIENKEKTEIGCIVARLNATERTINLISLYSEIKNDEISILKKSLSSIIGNDSLFLPASRTGLLLLYREFFANKKDEQISFTIRDGKLIENKDNSANLTKPVYEFLRFLQIYSENEDIDKEFKEELTFFEEHLIEGHISANKQGSFFYHSKDGNSKVPMYLASSMINEIVPLVLAITSQKVYDRLIIDEVEASLHPQKQLELVRFLNRLNNKGMKFILSTHSDTFVSKLNNLYVLSEIVKIKGEGILKHFNLEKEDLIATENLFVYEVVNQPNGKSIVNEIKGNPKTGYPFDLFASSAMHIYDEAMKLGEIQ